MKRFLAFAFYGYEAHGGMNDFIGDYDTLKEAVEAVQKFINEAMRGMYPDGHVYDTELRKIVSN